MIKNGRKSSKICYIGEEWNDDRERDTKKKLNILFVVSFGLPFYMSVWAEKEK
jgi:hypothetical protein